MMRGFEKLETERDRQQWEKFRLLATTLITPHTQKGKGVRPEKLWPFDWDKKQNDAPKMTRERLEYLSKRSEILKEHGGK